ncbi:MAG: class I SAM-dependent methyltransferase [Candidatus Sumerlaeia bacterium]|nr:class I SAM-dependent methyltransferase [Candidatus Sumerlaeia bacterium]
MLETATGATAWDVYWSERWRRRAAWLDQTLRTEPPRGWARLNALHLAQLLRRLGARRVLDAACGLGLGVACLIEEGFDAHGADASATAVAHASELLAERGLSARLLAARWEALPDALGEGTRFDAIHCDALVWAESEAEIAAAARAFAELLPRGGQVLFHGVFPLLDEAVKERLLREAVGAAEPREAACGALVQRTSFRREGDALVETHTFADAAGTERRCELRQLFRHTWRDVRRAFSQAGEWRLEQAATTIDGARRFHAVATLMAHPAAPAPMEDFL